MYALFTCLRVLFIAILISKKSRFNYLRNTIQGIQIATWTWNPALGLLWQT